MHALQWRILLGPLCFSAALAVTHVVHAADYPTTVQNIADLVAYWRFETATQADSSVGGYTGTFIGNAAVGGAGSGPTLIGIADNRSVLLDGAGDGVTTNLTDVNFSAAGTIVAWIWQDVLASDVRRILYICGRSQVSNDLDLQINPGDDRVHFYTTSGASVASTYALPLHQWVMVAATFDSATNQSKLYLDGQLVASSTVGAHGASGSVFTVGYSTVFAGRWFQGAVDEVAVYGRALTDVEIRTLHFASGELIFRNGFEQQSPVPGSAAPSPQESRRAFQRD